MTRTVQWFVLAACLSGTAGLLCYNCSTTHEEGSHCAGVFTEPHKTFNDSAKLLINCTEENSMCFLRTWRARKKYAWIVQRGCYHSSDPHDRLPAIMKKPTRSMACTHRRLSNAEYWVCLCRANWCNSASLVKPNYLVACILFIVYVMPFQLCLG